MKVFDCCLFEGKVSVDVMAACDFAMLLLDSDAVYSFEEITVVCTVIKSVDKVLPI